MSHESHVTPLDLDLLALGHITPEQRGRIEAHSAGCSACATRRAEHASHVQHFRTSALPRTLEHVIAAAEPGCRPKLSWRWLLALAVPVAAAVLLLVQGYRPPPSSRHAQGDLGIKGATAQVFAQRHPSNTVGVSQVADGDRLAAGDALRFVLLPTGHPYVLIASIDGAGQVSVYYPFHGEASAAVDPTSTVPLPGSIVLDQAPGPERIFFIHSAQPLRTQTVRHHLLELGAGGARMIRDTKQLPIPDTVQSTLLFEKAESPR